MESECEVKSCQFDCITVATIRVPHLEGGASYESVARELAEYARAIPGLHLLLDFHRVSRVSVGFLAELTNLRRVVDAEGGTLRLCGLPGEVHDVLGVFGLEGLHLTNKTRQAVMKYIGELRRAQTGPFPPLLQRCAATGWPGLSFRVAARDAKKGAVR